MDEDDIKAERRYKAIDGFTDVLIDNMKSTVTRFGGDGDLLVDILGRREVIGELMDALHVAMPEDFGTKRSK